MPEGAVYLDHAATTPVAPEVIAAMQACMVDEGSFANPASIHPAGRSSAAAVARARTQVARLLHTKPECLIWTSGATEANNLAIQGVARARQHRGRHLITMSTEHKSVVDTFRALEREGFDVDWLHPSPDGKLSLETLAAALRHDTQLVSIMHVNNETGAIQDLHDIGTVCRERGVLLHCDAAQSAGKLALDLDAMPVDLLSVTAHKFYGPQGIGALYIASEPSVVVSPLMFGGAQERRIRPGTLPVQLIVGMGIAAAIAAERMEADSDKMTALNGRLWEGLANVPGIVRNGAAETCYPGLLNVSVPDIDGESLMLGMEPVCVSSGSACNSSSGESSYVLRALGRSDREAEGAVRFSFGRATSDLDVDTAIGRYRKTVDHLRALAPP